MFDETTTLRRPASTTSAPNCSFGRATGARETHGSFPRKRRMNRIIATQPMRQKKGLLERERDNPATDGAVRPCIDRGAATTGSFR